MRPTKTEYYMAIADTVSIRATCIRRRYGAVIVKSDVVVGTGYCGSPRGAPNCCDHGQCEREKRGAKAGEHYEWCVSVHGEANAIIPVESEKLKGSTMYISGRDVNTNLLVCSKPCEMCSRMIKNAQIKEVVYYEEGKIVTKLVEEL